MPKEEKDKRKRVPFLVPASFATSPAVRQFENATVCNLIFLDIDESKHAVPYVSSPQTLAEQMEPFSFVAYHTASSTPRFDSRKSLSAAASYSATGCSASSGTMRT